MSVSKTRALILCDFDGTITLDDMTNVVWDRCLDYDWRSRLVSESERGLITATEMVRRGYAGVRQNEEEILQLMRRSLRIRAGFAQLITLCDRRNWHFAVVSNGLRFYIEAALGNRLEIWAHDAQFDGRWQVELPQSMPLDSSRDFKSQVVTELKRRYPEAASFYIGDGRLDFEPAHLCDAVLCVRESTLSQLCRQEGLATHGFSDFSEVAAMLTQWLPPASEGMPTRGPRLV